MRVYEFSLGMGPRFFKRKLKNDTIFALKVFPIGGSVQLGEDMEDNGDPDSFKNKPVWQRMIVILAGAFLNLVLGLIACFILVGIGGEVPTRVISSFTKDAVSNEKLMVGDEIIKINNLTIHSPVYDIGYSMSNSKSGPSVDFLVRRNGKEILLENVSFASKENDRGGYEITRDFFVFSETVGFSNIFRESFGQMFSMSRLIVMSIKDIISGAYGLNSFSGPVGIVNVIEQSVTSAIEAGRTVEEGIFFAFSNGLNLFALITINVGIFNLLPIPALDGARFIFFCVEAVRRRPIKAEVEGAIHFAGFALLMLFMLVVTFNDIRKLLFGGGII
jgi:regulator of sigma E protease